MGIAACRTRKILVPIPPAVEHGPRCSARILGFDLPTLGVLACSEEPPKEAIPEVSALLEFQEVAARLRAGENTFVGLA